MKGGSCVSSKKFELRLRLILWFFQTVWKSVLNCYFLQVTWHSESDTQESGLLLQPVQFFKVIFDKFQKKSGSKKDKGWEILVGLETQLVAIVRSIRDWLPDCPVDDDTPRHGWSSDQCSDVKEKRKWTNSLSKYWLPIWWWWSLMPWVVEWPHFVIFTKRSNPCFICIFHKQ